ncbi:MAG: hypothetical protein Q8Q36_02355 [bacterium]|nr:hypothetical protein [bacterium]
MTKALVFAILAPIFYALANVILEHKFSRYNNLTIMIVLYSVVIAIAVIVRHTIKTDDPSFNFPSGNELWLGVVGLALILFFADFFFIGAYTNGGDLATITFLTVLFPVFASFFKFSGSKLIPGMVYVQPNYWLVAGYVFAAVAVLCVIKGAPPPRL